MDNILIGKHGGKNMFLEMDTLIRLGNDYEHAPGIALTRGADNVIHLKRTQNPKIIIFSTQDATPVGSGGNYYYANGWYNSDLYETKFYGGWGYATSASLYDFSNDTHQQYGGHLKEVGDGYFVITGASSTDYGATLEYWVSYGDESSLGGNGYIEGASGIILPSEWTGTGTNSTIKITTGFEPKRIWWGTKDGYTASPLYNVFYRWEHDFIPDYFFGQYSTTETQQLVGNPSNYAYGLKSIDSDGFTLSYYLVGTSSDWGSPKIVWYAFP